MKKIGITGNIGSGKTTICKIFSILGIPVFHADNEAKYIYENDDFKLLLKEKFGTAIFDTENRLLKKRLADIVFSDKASLEFLNKHIHPWVRDRFEQWSKNQPTVGLYVLYEAAILFESGHHKQLDGIIMVSAPEAIRLERLIKRDGTSEQDIRSRMHNQWPEEKKIGISDWVIKNDGKHFLIPQVIDIDKQIKSIL